MVSKEPHDKPVRVRRKKDINLATSTPVVSSTEIQPAVSTAPTVSDPEQKRIEDIIKFAQIEYANFKGKVVKEKRKEIESLDYLIKEFMGPFILIGYDLNNSPVEMISASSTADHDALLERLRRIMFRINRNIAESNGQDPYGFNS